jgi:hypothetical protein
MNWKSLSNNLGAVVKSYLHGLIVTEVTLAINGEKDWRFYGIAALVSFVLPLIRAYDKNDPVFGLVADTLEAKVEAAAPVAKTDAEKQATKPAK